MSLAGRRPPLDPSGAQAAQSAPTLTTVEAFDPAGSPSDRKSGAHWDRDEWHDGPARGVAKEGSWLWLYRDDARWWTLAGQPPAPLLRHQGAWWLKDRDMWFVVHEGEPWVWRSFYDWGAEGLFHPASGTQIVYSSDYSRAAVITPGAGAIVFDARTGAELGRIPQERMPPKRRPTAPRSIYFPPN